MDLALDKVWWRRVNYFVLVTGLVLLALSPLIAEPIAKSLAGMKNDLFQPRALAANALSFADLPSPSTEWMATVKVWMDACWDFVAALQNVLSGGVDAIKSVLPSYAAWHLDTLKAHPFLLLLLKAGSWKTKSRIIHVRPGPSRTDMSPRRETSAPNRGPVGGGA